jgi:hypothetical protein
VWRVRRWPTGRSAPGTPHDLDRAGADLPGRRLHPLIESKQAAAVRFIGFFAARTRRGLWFRNAAMRAMNFAPLTRVFAGEFRDDFQLPDYGIADPVA